MLAAGFGQKVPAGQPVLAVEPAGQYDEARHGVGAIIPGTGHALPAGHCSGAVIVGAGQKLPAGHCIGAAMPCKGQNPPNLQLRFTAILASPK
jgi:hypothetical protein